MVSTQIILNYRGHLPPETKKIFYHVFITLLLPIVSILDWFCCSDIRGEVLRVEFQ